MNPFSMRAPLPLMKPFGLFKRQNSRYIAGCTNLLGPDEENVAPGRATDRTYPALPVALYWKTLPKAVSAQSLRIGQ